jgi:hypothetical protein
LFDADFNYTSNTTLTEDVYLKKGYHPVSIYLLKEPDKESNLILQWKPEASSEWKKPGVDDFYHSSLK